MSRRAPDGARARDSGGRRSPGQRDHYAWWEYALMVLAVVLIVGGGVLLFRVITGSDEATVAPIPTPTVVLGCPEGQWLDEAGGTCVPQAQCAADQAYDRVTNTCTAPPPVLSRLSPGDGPPEGGTELTIIGAGFTPDASVTINGQPGVDTRVVDATTITTTTPPSTVFYPVDVTVTNGDGQVDTLDNVFTYNAPPVQNIFEIVPPDGSSDGGEAVIIKGQNFLPDARVSFYGRPATEVVVLDEGTIRATLPAAPVGPVTVNVRNPGQAAFTLEDGFTYVDRPPRVVTAIRPVEGAEAGGTEVTITGSGFADGAKVTIGGQAARKVKVVSSTRITAVTPPGTQGPAEVAVRNPGLPAAILVDGFTYAVGPTIDAVTPDRGTLAGGTTVTITGSGFMKESTVAFGAEEATAVKLVSDTALTAVTPAGKPGPVAVTVENPDQPPAVAKKAFTYLTAEEALAALPRCKPYSLPAVTAGPGDSVTLTYGDIFPSASGVVGGRLVDVTLVVKDASLDNGSVQWRSVPPRVVWNAPDRPRGGGALVMSYEADSCQGTAKGLTVPVSVR